MVTVRSWSWIKLGHPDILITTKQHPQNVIRIPAMGFLRLRIGRFWWPRLTEYCSSCMRSQRQYYCWSCSPDLFNHTKRTGTWELRTERSDSCCNKHMDVDLKRNPADFKQVFFIPSCSLIDRFHLSA